MSFLRSHPVRICDLGMNNMVLVPVGTRVTTPCARYPMLLARVVTHMKESAPLLKCQYLRDLPEWTLINKVTATMVDAIGAQ